MLFCRNELCLLLRVGRVKLRKKFPESFPQPQKSICLDTLYLATPHAFVDVLREMADELDCVMVVGHNPGIAGIFAGFDRDGAALSEGYGGVYPFTD